MPFLQSISLRTLLAVDAATCAGMGAVLALASGPVGQVTEIPPALLFYAGLALFPIAAVMAAAAMREPVHPAAAWLVILGNAAWVAGSLAVLVTGWVAPNALGVAFILAQALVVALLAMLEHGALRAPAPVARAG